MNLQPLVLETSALPIELRPYVRTRYPNLSRRRGVLQGMDESPAGRVICAEVPLAEMFGYSTDLRSATQGRATYTMEFAKYAEAPATIAEAIIKKH